MPHAALIPGGVGVPLCTGQQRGREANWGPLMVFFPWTVNHSLLKVGLCLQPPRGCSCAHDCTPAFVTPLLGDLRSLPSPLAPFIQTRGAGPNPGPVGGWGGRSLLQECVSVYYVPGAI